MNLKAIAEYVGTSVAMIENSYGRFISDRGLAPLMRAVGAGRRSETARNREPCGNLRLETAGQKRKPRVSEAYEVVPGGIEPPFAT